MVHKRWPYEIFIPNKIIKEIPWKHNLWEAEVLLKLPQTCWTAKPPKICLPVKQLAKIIHFSDTDLIIDSHRKMGIFAYSSKTGTKNSFIESNDEATFCKVIYRRGVLMKGTYSWWSIDASTIKPMLNEAPEEMTGCVSPLFGHSSIYGTTKLLVSFDDLIHCYRQSISSEQGVEGEVAFKLGGTLLYRRKISHVIIVYLKKDGQEVPADLTDYNDYEFDTNEDGVKTVTIERPFQGVIYEPIDPSGKTVIYSSWDCYVFAFYYPYLREDSHKVFCIPTRVLSFAKVTHYHFNKEGIPNQHRIGVCHRITEEAECPDYERYSNSHIPYEELERKLNWSA